MYIVKSLCCKMQYNWRAFISMSLDLEETETYLPHWSERSPLDHKQK